MSKYKDYSAKDVVVLSEIDAIRRNPGMYVGSIDINGLHQLSNELIDNSIDEVAVNCCNMLTVTILKNNACSVEDNGRGIPVDIVYHLENKSACEILLTKLHSGSKFTEGVYSRSAGLHGVGLCCVNALSKYLLLEVWKNGYYYKQEFSKGIPLTSLQILGATDKHGTKITFLPDETIFKYEHNFSKDTFYNRLNELSFLHPGLIVILSDEKDNTYNKFFYRKGISEYVKSISSPFQQLNTEHISINSINNTFELELCLQWTSSFEEKICSYVNSINTVYGGTHVDAMKKAIQDAVGKYAKDNKLISLNDNLMPCDIFEGLYGVISIKIDKPIFQGQTKNLLTNMEIYSELYDIVYSNIYTFLLHNQTVAISLIKKSVNASRIRNAARLAANAVTFSQRSVKISEEIYKEQFGVRSKNWHTSAVWITDDELLQKHVELLQVTPDASGLDVCCGSGVVGAAFKPYIKKMTGLDLTPEMVQLAKERLDEVFQGTVYNIPFEDNSFDLVVTREVLHLLPQPLKPVSEIFRILKPGAQFIVGQILPFSSIDGPWMYRVFKKKQPLVFNMFQAEDFVELLLSAGFTDLKTTEINVWESIDNWINTYETSIHHRHEIKDLFYNAPKEVKQCHPFRVLPSGEILDLWRWVIFSVKKPIRN